MPKKLIIIILPLFFFLCSTGCSQPGTSDSKQDTKKTVPDNAIIIEGYEYNPNPLHVKAGQAITVMNKNHIQHTVTSDDGKTFDTRLITTGNSAQFTIEEPGTYKYHCSIHPAMKGKIIVKE
ncbi:MAG: cupredoxin domain-containing protein [Vulcanimicrobiota bacterium]